MDSYISSFVYCDSIQTELTNKGPQQQIVTPLQMLAPIALPGNYSFAISCGIAGIDATKQNMVQIKFISTDGTVLNDTGEIPLPAAQEMEKSNFQGVMQFNLDMRNLIIKETGIHMTTVSLNNEELGVYKILVVKGER